MALWNDTKTPASPAPANAEPAVAARTPAPAAPIPGAAPAVAPVSAPATTPNIAAKPKERPEMKESVISAGVAIEGKIVGSGHVRVAGRFKGDVQVEGNLHIDAGAKLEGQVRASEVIISGELQGNIEGAKRVELMNGGIINGDVKAGSLTVAAGSRMRGQVEFGWEDEAKPKLADVKGLGSAS